MSGNAKSSSESKKPPAALTSIGATKPTITAQVHSIANRENSEEIETTCAILHEIRAMTVLLNALGY